MKDPANRFRMANLSISRTAGGLELTSYMVGASGLSQPPSAPTLNENPCHSIQGPETSKWLSSDR
jgi:hypothetical protein